MKSMNNNTIAQSTNGKNSSFTLLNSFISILERSNLSISS